MARLTAVAHGHQQRVLKRVTSHSLEAVISLKSVLDLSSEIGLMVPIPLSQRRRKHEMWTHRKAGQSPSLIRAGRTTAAYLVEAGDLILPRKHQLTHNHVLVSSHKNVIGSTNLVQQRSIPSLKRTVWPARKRAPTLQQWFMEAGRLGRITALKRVAHGEMQLLDKRATTHKHGAAHNLK